MEDVGGGRVGGMWEEEGRNLGESPSPLWMTSFLVVTQYGSNLAMTFGDD